MELINQEEIEKLALLARIKLSPEELKNLHGDINSILSYVRQVQEVSDVASKDLSEGIFADLKNTMRSDENPHEGGKFSEDILKQAPKREKNYFKVKKIL
jgi:aspartyl-tRNA(Asn)/glutamyl-tRNA(Gln) amidotransferase subunit C